ncbi:MAG: RHS repeat protein, partial [Hymenobacter sp.]
MSAGPTARCTRTWGDEGIYDHKLIYDVAARRTVVTNSLGYATTYIGNENGLVVEVQDAQGGVTLTDYNDYNEVLRETNQLGYGTAYAYDERGNCLRATLPDGASLRRTFDAEDKLIQLVDPVGAQWHWAYDAAGNLLVETDALGTQKRYSYAQGRLQRAVDAASKATDCLYDEAGNLTELRTDENQAQRWLYDGWGRARKLIDARGNVQWRAYDLLSRVTTVHEPDGNVRHFAYDGLGNVVRMRDRHYDVHYYYRGMGRLIRRVEAGAVVEFWHDTEEQLRAVVNEQGLAYRFELDRVGAIVAETGFDGLTRRYQRDQAGQVVEVELPTGQCTRYSYDPTGRITAISYANGSQQTYQYRADGTLLAADLDGKTVRLAYDSSGRLEKESQGPHELTNAYDKLGRRVGVTSSLGAAVHYTRNKAGDAERMQTANWQALLEYDAYGAETQRTLSSGVHTKWQRDQAGRPLTQRIRTRAGYTERVRTYGWQENNQLIELADSLRGTTRFAYDTVGNLAAATFGDGMTEKRWPDAVGNLFRTEQHTDRQYGPAGRLVANQGTRYTYDQAGNLSAKRTADQQEWHYSWNAQGHLAEVVRPDGSIVHFEYDALGRRVSKAYRGCTTHWLWDGNTPLHEWTTREEDAQPASAIITWLFQDQSFIPMARLQGESCCDILTDHLGTPFAVHDSQGKVIWDAEFTTYGQLRQAKGDALVCPFRYQGQYEDMETGLYYNGLRYYDPATGQYISQDPIGLRGGMLAYGYVRDTNNWIDPL